MSTYITFSKKWQRVEELTPLDSRPDATVGLYATRHGQQFGVLAYGETRLVVPLGRQSTARRLWPQWKLAAVELLRTLLNAGPIPQGVEP